MAFNYSSLSSIASSQITDKGRQVTVRYLGNNEAYDPETDTYTAGTNTDVTAYAVFTEFDKKDIDGELIKQEDKKLLIAGEDLTNAPQNSSKIIDGSLYYEVIDTEIVKPGGTILLYKIHVRGGYPLEM